MSVARFMDLALGHPEFGYYRTRDPLGARGDFITAPEISQMFGEIIGLWAATVWQDMGRPDPFILAELGPGRGTLMADMLRAGRVQPGFIEAAKIHLVETSPVLRTCQAETLGRENPEWHDAADNLPAGPAIIVANEFFDALPIHQFLFNETGWTERCIAGENPFHFVSSPLSSPCMFPDNAAPGTIKEMCPAGKAIVETVAKRFFREKGALLIIDYGYGDGAVGETLQAVRDHEFTDPLDHPGEADITAHVDFQALGRAARAAGCVGFGPVTQGRFLRDLGIVQRARRLCENADAARKEMIESALKRLTAPSEMGNLFKVMAICGAAMPPLPGFPDLARGS